MGGQGEGAHAKISTRLLCWYTIWLCLGGYDLIRLAIVEGTAKEHTV